MGFPIVFPFLMVAFLSIAASKVGLGCVEREREALLKFKQGLKDPNNRLSSWVGEDCCKWKGIRCNNRTRLVVEISLRNPYQEPSSIRKQVQLAITGEGEVEFKRWCLSGEIHPSLLELKHLNHMDLSRNCFGGMGIPTFIGSFNKLQYLNLSMAGFGGVVPPEIGNLTTLQCLDLGNNGSYYETPNQLQVNSLHWLSHLSSLQQLDMGDVNFSMATDWLQSVNMLPSLEKLILSNCSIGHISTTLPSPFLNYLDLSDSMLGPTIPPWLFNLSKIEYLDLSSNNFRGTNLTLLGKLCHLRTLRLRDSSLGGEISRFNKVFSGCISRSLEVLNLGSNGLNGSLPHWLWQFTNLKYLRLSGNNLSGPIPSSIGSLRRLKFLYLNGNQLDGTIPKILGQLSNLQKLDMSNNSFQDVLSVAHFSGLKNLKYLVMSFNSCALNVSSNWVPPFQLKTLKMNHCRLGPKFPAWLQTQKELTHLSLSHAGISDSIPDFFWNISSGISSINLSNNLISGSIASCIGEVATNLIHLELSYNHLQGSIPLSICRAPLMSLHLSANKLTNEIPFCIGDLHFLVILHLRNNHLSGEIPNSIGHLSWLASLHLNKNNLSGELPPTLQNCSRLVTLDLSENGFIGKMPTWIGERMPLLKFLMMRSNKFEGNIPLHLSLLSHLQVLDLAKNNLSGAIPSSFGNFSAMATPNKMNEVMYSAPVFTELEYILVHWKGSEYEYNRTISLMMYIDLSSNNLCGEIPQEVTRLRGLENLNFSNNHFTGSIPKNIGDLRWMQTLDFSLNQLSGVIPPSLLDLMSLSCLNLSYNNLSGRIPMGRQLDTLNINSSIILGNPLLCGPPLSNQCPEDGTSQDPLVVAGEGQDKDVLNMQIFYLSMSIGFIVGFLLVCAIFLYKRSWRIAYFHFFDDMGDLLYVVITRKVNKF